MTAAQSFDPPPLVPGSLASPFWPWNCRVHQPTFERFSASRWASTIATSCGNRSGSTGSSSWEYWLLFSLLGLVLASRRWPVARLLGAVTVLGALSRQPTGTSSRTWASCSCSTRPARELNQTMTDHVRFASLMKWGLLALVAACLSILFLTYGRRGVATPYPGLRGGSLVRRRNRSRSRRALVEPRHRVVGSGALDRTGGGLAHPSVPAGPVSGGNRSSRGR